MCCGVGVLTTGYGLVVGDLRFVVKRLWIGGRVRVSRLFSWEG